ncbi:unnamed protein product [Arctia plantaginis]|uniref:LITAF domain-containing protein n=1 Tax=Arctia plantaginis TaxID=874455 RepID=A0A8S1BFZ0_ARCPL|nr:unnamed protein product [Arctia plantaginis]
MEFNNEKVPRPMNPPAYSEFPPEKTTMQMPSVVISPPLIQTNTPIIVPVVVGRQMGPKPASLSCPSCHAQITTRVERKTTTKTHLFALLLCFLGCWCCVCVPYCMDSCQNADHYCPSCNAYIGSYSN